VEQFALNHHVQLEGVRILFCRQWCQENSPSAAESQCHSKDCAWPHRPTESISMNLTLVR